jgi:hypothetical protein
MSEANATTGERPTYDEFVTGGGAATSSGIDFQHRVGAAAIVAMTASAQALRWLWLDARDEVVTEVRFETGDAIDDLVIITDGPRILVQAKRSLSFSASDESEFASVIGQFVDQFAAAPDAHDIYLLAVSPSASNTIKVDLRKLTEGARLNELGPAANPLTQAETDVLEKIYALIERRFASRTGRVISTEERATLFARIHVAALDLERSGNLESAVLTAIASQTMVDAEAVWSSFVALALALAKERLSIDRDGLRARIGHLLIERADGNSESVAAEATKIVAGDPISAGREVVLAEDEDERLVLVELIRFDDDGSRRVRFADGDLNLPNGIHWRVLRRTSTFAGMERLLLADPATIEGRDVAVLPIHSDHDYESSPWALAHAALCEERLQRPSVLECIECGRPISESSPHAAEIDEEGLPHDVGLIHSACLRPTHRVLGAVSIEPFTIHQLPPDFDHKTWVETRPTGQGAFNSQNPTLQNRIVTIGWKPGQLPSSSGSWGVAYTLEDGSMRYVRERGRVTRQTKERAEADAQMMNETLAAATAGNDPFCVSASGAFGPYSVLLQTEPGATTQSVLSAEARQLTRETLIANDEVENFYAPLVSLIDASTDGSFVIGNARVLVTDPIGLHDRVANWKRAGVEVPTLNTSVIRSDDQFDAFVINAFRTDFGVVIDPVLDPSGQPVAGFLVADLEAILARGHEQT